MRRIISSTWTRWWWSPEEWRESGPPGRWRFRLWVGARMERAGGVCRTQACHVDPIMDAFTGPDEVSRRVSTRHAGVRAPQMAWGHDVIRWSRLDTNKMMLPIRLMMVA